MALILNGTTGITVTDGSNILQDGTVTTDDLAAGAVTSAKMAVGAAATNLGNYVSSFNGSTGAVTGVSTVNGSSGAVTVVSTVNGSTGAVTVQATLVSGSNIKSINGTSLLGSGDLSVGASTSYNAIGTYVFGRYYGSSVSTGSTVSPGGDQNQLQAGSIDDGGFEGSMRPSGSSNNLSGTWRWMGGTSGDGFVRGRYAVAVRIS